MLSTLGLAPVQLQEVNGTDYTKLSVHIDAQIFSALRVRRKVNGWLAMEVGGRRLAGEPELIIGEPLYWRVPLDWTSPTQGLLEARIAEVLVDATTGEILDPLNKMMEIQRNVKRAARAVRTHGQLVTVRAMIRLAFCRHLR
jgi:hypothetical protein